MLNAFVWGFIAAFSLVIGGLMASFFHLGHPERGWRAIARWRTSWLSREVIVLPAFMGMTALYGLVHYLDLNPVLFTFREAFEVDLSADDYEFQMLYGMADNLKTTLVKGGHQIRIYVPYGEPLPGMAYLVRRLLENTSGQTILDAGMGQAMPAHDCLQRPMPHIPRSGMWTWVASITCRHSVLPMPPNGMPSMRLSMRCAQHSANFIH